MTHFAQKTAASQTAWLRRPENLLPLGPWLRWGWHGLFVKGHTSNQFMRFCLVGASGVVVNSAVMWSAMNFIKAPYILASILAFLVATVNNFFWNKTFTFQDKKLGATKVLSQYARFLGVTLFGLGINLGVLAFLVEFFHTPPLLANLAGIAVATFSNFLGNKFFAFQR